MSTRQAALRADAAASSAPVTASPRRFGLPASATCAASAATRAPIPAISSGTRAAPRNASGRWPGRGLEHGRVGAGVHVGQLGCHLPQRVGLVRQLAGPG